MPSPGPTRTPELNPASVASMANVCTPLDRPSTVQTVPRYPSETTYPPAVRPQSSWTPRYVGVAGFPIGTLSTVSLTHKRTPNPPVVTETPHSEKNHTVAVPSTLTAPTIFGTWPKTRLLEEDGGRNWSVAVFTTLEVEGVLSALRLTKPELTIATDKVEREMRERIVSASDFFMKSEPVDWSKRLSMKNQVLSSAALNEIGQGLIVGAETRLTLKPGQPSEIESRNSNVGTSRL